MTRENALVSAQWVEENLDNPKVVLIEVDEDTSAYDKGHIKGAIKLDWTTDLQDVLSTMLTKRRAVDHCRVRSSLCRLGRMSRRV